MKRPGFLLGFVFLAAFTTTFIAASIQMAFAQEQIIPWKFSSNGERVVAVGDIHGDLGALVKILRKKNLINESGNWIGGKAQLVLMGDLIDRGPDSMAVSAYVRNLENQAGALGGQVHALLGNHEMNLAEGVVDELKRPELLKLARSAGLDTGDQALARLTSNESELSAWLASRNSVIQIDDKIFVHAGLEKWAVDHSFDEINSRVRQWISYRMGIAKTKPAASTAWMVDSAGPLWTRVFQIGRPKAEVLSELSVEQLDGILKRESATQIVVGHNPVDAIVLRHPVFGKRVVMIDTAISSAKGLNGTLSAIEVDHGVIKAETFVRDRPAAWINRIRDQAIQSLTPLLDPLSGCALRLKMVRKSTR